MIRCVYASFHCNSFYIWVNYNISLTWIKAVLEWFPLKKNTISSEGEQWGRYNLPRYMGVSENSVPLNPMVFLIIIPFLNGYFIGKINPTFSGPNPYDWWLISHYHPLSSIIIISYPILLGFSQANPQQAIGASIARTAQQLQMIPNVHGLSCVPSTNKAYTKRPGEHVEKAIVSMAQSK